MNVDVAHVSWRNAAIAVLAILAIATHLIMRVLGVEGAHWPLWIALGLGGVPLVIELTINLVRGEFGSDLLAGISIVTATLLDEHLAGVLVVLMLSGGETLEAYAVRSASSTLDALARRMPGSAHKKVGGELQDVDVETVEVGDELVVLPHEMCPVDGTVIDGHGAMDESFLTGEPYLQSKAPGAAVISGAVNGESAITIRADREAKDSRYAKIMQVMKESQQRRPKIRRMGDQLGAIYTPIAVAIAIIAWVASGDPVRFLAVLVVATPCPLLIAIPVSIISAISLAAKRGIIIRDPVVLEKVDRCTTVIFDKTGTLTYGRPSLTEILAAEGVDADELLALTASLEQYSRHPLAEAVIKAAHERSLEIRPAAEVSEPPGAGLRGVIDGRAIRVTSRKHTRQDHPDLVDQLPPVEGGLECVLFLDDAYAGMMRFRDAPRDDSGAFLNHLGRRHRVEKVMLVSGDRAEEVEYLAKQVGIEHVYADQSPEDKVRIVQEETARGPTVFVGDGVNDAPALLEATVGIAMGAGSDVITEAAGAIVMEQSLLKVDELMHIGARMRKIALQSVIGGMGLSIIAMIIAAFGYLDPVAGAIVQEVIDVVAILNALRMAIPPKTLSDVD